MATMTETQTLTLHPCLMSETFQHSISLLKASASGTRSERDTSMFSLPDDVLLLIISYIEVKDIISLRKTSKRLFTISKLRWVWTDALKRHVIGKGLPIPKVTGDLKALSSEDLEARVVHAARFHENWNSPQPKARQSIQFQVDNRDDVPALQNPTIKQVLFLPGHDGELLVTLVGRTITCWEVPLDGSGAYVVAEWIHDKKIEQFIVNEDPSNDGSVLAYSSVADPEHGVVDVVVLGLDKFHGCFLQRAVLRGHRGTITPMHTMVGEAVILGDPLWTWFTSSPVHVVALPRDSVPSFGSDRILAVKIIDRYIFVFRENGFYLTFAPLWKGRRTKYTGSSCITVYSQYQHCAREAVIVTRNPPSAEEDAAEPVTVLLRCCDDGYDTVRQLDFLPRPQSTRTEDVDGPPTDTEVTLPWILPRSYSRIVGVAPSSCHFAAGSSGGKGFWIQTRNVVLRHSVFPARCLVGFQVRHPNRTPLEATKGRDCEEMHSAPAGELLVGDSTLYARPCDMMQVLLKKYSITVAALEDTVGRIAIGDTLGRVEVLDFA